MIPVSDFNISLFDNVHMSDYGEFDNFVKFLKSNIEFIIENNEQDPKNEVGTIKSKPSMTLNFWKGDELEIFNKKRLMIDWFFQNLVSYKTGRNYLETLELFYEFISISTADPELKALFLYGVVKVMRRFTDENDHFHFRQFLKLFACREYIKLMNDVNELTEKSIVRQVVNMTFDNSFKNVLPSCYHNYDLFYQMIYEIQLILRKDNHNKGSIKLVSFQEIEKFYFEKLKSETKGSYDYNLIFTRLNMYNVVMSHIFDYEFSILLIMTDNLFFKEGYDNVKLIQVLHENNSNVINRHFGSLSVATHDVSFDDLFDLMGEIDYKKLPNSDDEYMSMNFLVHFQDRKVAVNVVRYIMRNKIRFFKNRLSMKHHKKENEAFKELMEGSFDYDYKLLKQRQRLEFELNGCDYLFKSHDSGRESIFHQIQAFNKDLPDISAYTSYDAILHMWKHFGEASREVLADVRKKFSIACQIPEEYLKTGESQGLTAYELSILNKTSNKYRSAYVKTKLSHNLINQTASTNPEVHKMISSDQNLYRFASIFKDAFKGLTYKQKRIFLVMFIREIHEERILGTLFAGDDRLCMWGVLYQVLLKEIVTPLSSAILHQKMKTGNKDELMEDIKRYICVFTRHPYKDSFNNEFWSKLSSVESFISPVIVKKYLSGEDNSEVEIEGYCVDNWYDEMKKIGRMIY